VRLRLAASIPSDLRGQVERSMIAADAEFLLNLVLSPRLEPIRPTAILMLMPFSSAFLYESIRYTKRERPESLRELRSHHHQSPKARCPREISLHPSPW